MKNIIKSILEKFAPGILLRIRSYKYSNHEPEIQYIDRFCSLDGLSIDIGAHQGAYTYVMSKKSKNCIAFEAHPDFAEKLKRAVPKNVAVYNIAISDSKGIVSLKIPNGKVGLATINANNNSTVVKENLVEIDVSASSLDDLIDEKVYFIKIDVEGHELSVLNGAVNILKTYSPVVMVEVEERHISGSIGAVNSFFNGMLYKGYFLVDGILKDINEFNINKYQCLSNLGQPVAPYINNFIFIKS